MEMFKYLISCLPLLTVFLGSTVSDSNLVLIQNVGFYSSDRFPEVIRVFFSYQGNDIYLNLKRDDETTAMLSEDVFEASAILPSGLYKEDKSEEFAAYDSGNSDVLVVHREREDAEPKFYGRFTHASEKMTIQSVDGSHEIHRVWRENDMDNNRRIRRDATTPDNVIELFIFSDLSFYEHVRDEMLPQGEIRGFIKNYLSGVAKEVDSVFKYLDVYGASKALRVYFQQYQIIDKSKQQKWVENNLSGGVLQTAAVSDLQAYYSKLITKFGFPYPDHLMAITKLEMEGGVQVLSTGTVCGASSAVGTSIVRIDNFPVTLAQGIALTFSVPFDGVGNDCTASDQYIMSATYGAVMDPGNQGNRWQFSPCSFAQFQAALDGSLDLSCLQTEDKYFNWEQFNKAPLMGQLLTPDQQCVIRYQSGATFCDESQDDVVDCYSSSQGCFDVGVCKPFTVAQLTPCWSNLGNNFRCQYGFCNITSTTSSTTSTTSVTTGTSSTSVTTGTSSTSVTTETTTEDDGGLQTTTPAPYSCVVKTSIDVYDIPGCGCEGCESSNSDSECNPSPDCPGKRVKVKTTYVRKECASNYEPGPRTYIQNADGSTDLMAEVFQDTSDQWQVELAPRS